MAEIYVLQGRLLVEKLEGKEEVSVMVIGYNGSKTTVLNIAEVAKLFKALGQFLTTAAGQNRPEMFFAESIFGAVTRRGLVKLTVGNEEKKMHPDDARAFAMSIFAAAEAAEMDEVLVRFLTETKDLQFPDEAAAALLREFRQLRAARSAQG